MSLDGLAGHGVLVEVIVPDAGPPVEDVAHRALLHVGPDPARPAAERLPLLGRAAPGEWTPRGLWLVLAISTPVAATIAALGLLPLWRRDPTLAAAVTVLFTGVFAIGLALLGEPGQRAPGYALIGSALTLVLSWVNEWGVGPLPLLSTAVGNVWLLLGAWALYRYPEPRLSPWDRRTFQLMFAWFVVVPWVDVLVSRPQSHGFPAGSWWPSLWQSERAEDVVDLVQSLGLVVVAAVYLARWAARMRSIRPAERRLKWPPAVAAVVATLAAGGVPAGTLLGLTDAAMDRVYLLEALATLTVPVAFLLAIVGRQLARTRVTDLVLGVRGPLSTKAVVTALRTALEDPGVQVAYWSADDDCYLDDDGAPVPVDPTPRNRLYAAVTATDGRPLALITADASLVREPDRLDAAATVVGFSLENARLVETVRRQLADLQAASARAVAAGDAERRRLEQDLHDGAQQHLLALGPLIGVAEAATTDPRTARQLAEIRDLLTRGMRELRDFARGIRPAALDLGLGRALDERCRSLPFRCEVDVPDQPLPAATAHAAYLVVSEALTNAARHSGADRAWVRGRLDRDVLRLEVGDDGVGGADVRDADVRDAGVGGGTGLRNIHDRVTALGGRFELVSPPGQGTLVRIELPCG